MWRLVFVLLCLAVPSHACLNDMDSLATEAKGLPDVLRVITGRFERNPPLFYEMRLARVTKEIKTQPAKLELYDDAGVACDRLHHDDEAIAWMKEKRAQLKPFPQDKEHWYRYHANLGTFQAHNWLRSGANRKNMAEMKTARDNIKRAIQIKPDAHFGREKYQLMAMEWIIKGPKPDQYNLNHGKLDRLPIFLSEKEQSDYNEAAAAAAVTGLTGLIVLGDAWESVDTFMALSTVLYGPPAATLSYLAALRCEELAKKGKHSLYPFAPAGHDLFLLIERQKTSADEGGESGSDLQKQFIQLRAEADDFQKHRTNYMMTRLKAGRHPDTDKTFWNDWKDSGPPVIDETMTPVIDETMRPEERFIRNLMLATISGMIGFVIWRFYRKRQKARLAT